MGLHTWTVWLLLNISSPHIPAAVSLSPHADEPSVSRSLFLAPPDVAVSPPGSQTLQQPPAVRNIKRSIITGLCL